MDCEIVCPQKGDTVWTPTYGSAGTVSRVLSDFEEVELLGEGAFGSVSRVKCKIDQQSYAIKKIILEFDYGYERATREVIAMARLSHSNVVRYHTAWLEEGWAGNGAGKSKQGPMTCIQMELCFGCLKDLMGKELTDEKLWDIFRQTITGVDYIHSQSVRHGDLSPANLFLDEAREIIKIGDFGFSSAANGVLGFDEVRVQSFYCAPELRSRLEVGVSYSLKSDIYSLGVILLELFARYDAVEDVSRRRSELTAFADSGELPGWTTTLDEEVLRLILVMTDSDPKIRPTTGQILVLQPWAGK